jgi:hypothetical protein
MAPARRTPPVQDDGIPKCNLCRNGSYATLSFKLFPTDEQETCYCDTCGPAMLSVLKDTPQKRVPEVHRLAPPPKIAPPPPPPPKVVAPPPPEPKREPPKVAPPPRVVPKVQEEEHDLLSLLGWKR